MGEGEGREEKRREGKVGDPRVGLHPMSQILKNTLE